MAEIEPELDAIIKASPELKVAIETHHRVSEATRMADFIGEVLSVSEKSTFRVGRLQLALMRRAMRRSTNLLVKLYEENQLLRETIEKYEKEN